MLKKRIAGGPGFTGTCYPPVKAMYVVTKHLSARMHAWSISREGVEFF